jgi:hypothetical protein
MNKFFTSTIAAALISAPVLGIISLLNPSSSVAQSVGRKINLPFNRSQTWYVCNGYNGTGNNRNASALDLRLNSCSGYGSVGQLVRAPGSGTVWHQGQDMVCLKLDTGGSLLIGHMVRALPNVTRVSTDDVLGSVSAVSYLNDYNAQIHIQAHRSSYCTGPTYSFTDGYGFRFNDVPDLPNTGRPNEHYGRTLRR